MADTTKKIVLNLAGELDDRAFRSQFFTSLTTDEIAMQIRLLRDLRGMRQVDLAEAAGMKQSAVARLEKAEYAAWNYRTLCRIASALDVRLRVVFQPAEDAVAELVAFEAEAAVNGNKEAKTTQTTHVKLNHITRSTIGKSSATTGESPVTVQ